jgi:hypothetical protein
MHPVARRFAPGREGISAFEHMQFVRHVFSHGVAALTMAHRNINGGGGKDVAQSILIE